MISANYQISLILPFVTKPLVIIFFLRQLFLQCYNLLLLVFGSASFFLLSESFQFSVAAQISQLKFLPHQLFLQSIIFLLRSESLKSSVPSSFCKSTSLVRSVTSSSIDSLLDNSLLNVTLRPFFFFRLLYIRHSLPIFPFSSFISNLKIVGKKDRRRAYGRYKKLQQFSFKEFTNTKKMLICFHNPQLMNFGANIFNKVVQYKSKCQEFSSAHYLLIIAFIPFY